MSINQLEDLRVWQEARELCKDLYALAKDYPVEEKYSITRHIKENARAIASNIAEGFFRFHYQDSIRFYFIARGCLGELKSDLYLSLDQNFITDEKFREINQRIEKILIMLNSLIKSTKDQINKISDSY